MDNVYSTATINDKQLVIRLVKSIQQSDYKQWFFNACQQSIEQQLSLSTWNYKHESYQAFIVCYDQQPVGVFCFSVNDSFRLLNLEFLHVDEKFRNQGIAKLLYNIILEHGRQLKCYAFSAVIHINNIKSKQLIESFGFNQHFVVYTLLNKS